MDNPVPTVFLAVHAYRPSLNESTWNNVTVPSGLMVAVFGGMLPV
jgi:hypothetical protein